MSDKSLRRHIQERLGYETRPSSRDNYIDSDEYLYPPTKEWTCIPWYETEIDDAWELIEKMTDCQYVKVSCEQSHYHGCACRVVAADESQRRENDIVRRNALEFAETMPEAICKAFLKATEKDS